MKKVIIIEDDPTYTRLLRSKLTEEYQCACYSSISDYKNNAENFQPDLMLVDYYLPEGNALQFIKNLRTKFMSLPIVAMSASRDDKIIHDSYGAGASFFYQKTQPFASNLLQPLKMLRGQR